MQQQNFFHRRSYKTATDEQLFASLEHVRREHSDSNYPPLPDVFRSWANQAGFPILNVEVSRERKSAKISQELFVPGVNLTEKSEFFILFNYATLSSGFVNTSASGWLHKEDEVQHSLQMGDDDKWSIFNVKQTGECHARAINYFFHPSDDVTQAIIALITTPTTGMR